MRYVIRVVVCAVLPMVLMGCKGDPLWSRYRAERELWQAERLVERVRLRPQTASPADFERAAAALERLAAEFPASVWASGERARDSVALDVADVSGRALILRGALEELRGHPERAVEIYRRVRQEYAVVVPVAVEAMVGVATALERSGDSLGALAAVGELAREYPLVEPRSGEPMLPVLDAPLRLAHDLAVAGRRASADSVLEAAEDRLERELEYRLGQRAAPVLWLRLATVRNQLGRLDPALNALRRILAEPHAAGQEGRVWLGLASFSVDGGRLDSALAYARRAAKDEDVEVSTGAMLMIARIWERRGSADSALGAYAALIDDRRAPHDSVVFARFRRAVVLEQNGRWPQARAEYRALTSLQGTHPLAFESLRRIVDYHLEHGEPEMARVEAKRSIESLDRMIAIYRDEGVVMTARRTRAELLVKVEDYLPAVDALADLWNRYGGTPAGVSAGLDAARLAETALGDRVRALRLYREIAERATRAADQSAARTEVQRLERQRS